MEGKQHNEKEGMGTSGNRNEYEHKEARLQVRKGW
jgi:hypothetical protein